MGASGGYQDRQIEPGVYEVFFSGNGGVTQEQGEQYWHRRARELCGGAYDHTFEGSGKEAFSMMLPVGGLMVPVSGTHPKIRGTVRCK